MNSKEPVENSLGLALALVARPLQIKPKEAVMRSSSGTGYMDAQK